MSVQPEGNTHPGGGWKSKRGAGQEGSDLGGQALEGAVMFSCHFGNAPLWYLLAVLIMVMWPTLKELYGKMNHQT